MTRLPRGPIRDGAAIQIRAMVDAGMSNTTIAAKLGISAATVSVIRREYNIQRTDTEARR